MPKNEITEMFSVVVRKWRTADSQRTIFGVEMLQTKNAINELSESLKEVFDVFPTFSLIKKDQAMEIIVKTDVSEDNPSGMTSIPANFPSMPKVFTQLNIDSISLNKGVTGEELKELFKGMSMKSEDIDEQGGLKGFLNKQKVTRINVDQMKFELLKEGEQIGRGLGAGSGSGPGAGEGAGGLSEAKGKRSAGLSKMGDSVWNEYLSGKLDKNDFRGQHKDLIDAASEDPKQIEKLLKRMMAKQKETEKFLAQLEQKLFEAGFPEEAIKELKKKLLKPKKILVAEDELARLKKIEKEFLTSADQRIENTAETINIIKKKLSDETARSEAIVKQMGQGGMILDREGKVLSVNATAQKVLGLSEKDILGKSVKDILKTHHTWTAVSDWQNETETHTPSEVKVLAQNDETLAIIRESAIVIENETGRSVGVVSALHNVTQQEELNRRKNDILDVLGHDLRAPLGAIKMNFDVLADSDRLNIAGTEQQKKFLDNCQKSIERMQKLIEKVLDTRQLESGKIMLKYDTIETGSLLEQAVTSQSDWAKNKNITLKINAANLPNIEGDPERLYQVITNLVSNALKFTPEGGSIIAEGTAVKSEGIEYIEVSVRDSGMGIGQEDLKRIFDKYEQVTVNAPEGVRGLGLGLSICKAIVDLHGGSIRVNSELGKGSTFTFQVPVKRKDKNS